MKNEYDALRAEMLAWQNRRISILALSISLVTGILGLYGVAEGSSLIAWELVSSLLWFFLGSAAVLTWYAGQANAKIAAYIIVFHEADADGWETRLRRLKGRRFDWFNLNRMVLLIYVGLGMLSALVPSTIRDAPLEYGWKVSVLAVCGTWFVFSQCLLLLQPSKQLLAQRWRESEQGG